MSWQERAAARAIGAPVWLRALALFAMLGSLGVTLYWGFTYSGPYRLLAEWQLRHLGEYEVILTGLCTLFMSLLFGLLPVVLAVQIVGARSNRAPSPEALAAYQARGDSITKWVAERRYRLVAAGVSIGIALFGSFLAVTGATAGTRASVDVAVLEQGRAPPSHYVELQGRLLIEQAVGVTRRGPGVVRVYVPVVSDAWRSGQPVRAYLETYEPWLDKYASDLATGRYEGVLSDLPLPGVAQTTLTERGLRPAERYWVLDYRQKPGEEMLLGLGLLAAGVLFGAATA